MRNLMGQLVGLLADLVIAWLLPIVGAALFSVLAAIAIAANPWIGGGIVIVVAALLVHYCAQQGAVWQAVMWGVVLGGYGLLALFAPAWALLWGLGLSALALGALMIVPGAVLPPARPYITATLMAAVVLHAVLATAVGVGGLVFPIVLGLLALAMGSFFFSQGVRPWELRAAQRRAGRLLTTIGLLAVVAGLTLPILGQVQVPELSAPAPLSHIWSGLSARTEGWALSAQRTLLGERAKTRSLEELQDKLRDAHRERWRRAIDRIPSAPLNQEEWRDLGVPSDP